MDRRTGAVFAVCAVPRLVALLLYPPASTNYDELATSLLTTGRFAFDGVPSTYLDPLYPMLLASARMVTGNSQPLVLALQIAIASIGGVFLYCLASRLAGPRAALYAAVFYALNPYLVRQSVALVEVTLCTTLVIAVTLQLSNMERMRQAIACGVLFGLLLLTRSSSIPACAGAAIWLAWTGRGRLAAVMLVTAAAVLTPWLIRNARMDGSPLPSRLGENLYLSTSRYASIVPRHDIDLLIPIGVAEVEGEVAKMGLPPHLEQRALDEAMLARAMAFIRDRPGRALWLKVRNAAYLFSPQILPRYPKSRGASATVDSGAVYVVNGEPRPWIEDAAHAVAQSALMLLTAVGFWRRGLSPRDAPLLIMFAAQAAVCIVFFPTTRLMAPVMFVLMFYAAAGLDGFKAPSAAAPLRP